MGGALSRRLCEDRTNAKIVTLNKPAWGHTYIHRSPFPPRQRPFAEISALLHVRHTGMLQPTMEVWSRTEWEIVEGECRLKRLRHTEAPPSDELHLNRAFEHIVLELR